MKRLRNLYHYIFALAAYWFYGRPARKIIVVGVTGTKGKSTTCRFIASVLEAGGHKVGVMSTVEFQIADERRLNTKKMTMLGRGEVQKMLRDMVRAGCRYAVIETSSEGIMQYRHLGLHYDVCVFTNLGTEHSERHGGFDNLRKAKGEIFAGLKNEQTKIIGGRAVKKIIIANVDDANAPYYLNFSADKKIGFRIKNAGFNSPDIQLINAKITSSDSAGSTFQIQNSIFKINIPGDFNVYNALAAAVVGASQNISEEQIITGLSSVKLVEGRMEYIDAGQPFKVIVDYAHEPMSLTNLFETLRKIAAPGHKVIGVVGSDGGGRDKNKRAQMGEIAGRLCDSVVITDVNCFDEDPRAIADMLAQGARNAGKIDGQNLFIEIDRRQGITKAISLAREGDVVAITAKGTEPCIVVAGGKKIPWDDRAVAKEILNNHGFKR